MFNYFAKTISAVTDPKYVFALFFFYLALVIHKSILELILLTAYITATFFYTKRLESQVSGQDTFHFDNPAARLVRYKTYLLTAGVTMIALASSLAQGVGESTNYLLTLLLTTLILFFIALAFKFKVSAHVSYTGMIVMYFYASIEGLVLFAALTLLIGTARIYLRKHNFQQVLSAFILVSIMFILYDFIQDVAIY